ncbi:MAG TPA: NnrU family protein [Aliidongia sp.]|nr:NnrU family protein [Aliidongia sp.]
MIETLHSLVLAGVIFLGSHVLISSTPLRGTLRDSLGEGGYLGLYSMLAAVTLGWFVVAFIRAPAIPVWQPPLWTHWITIALLPIASILMVGSFATRNPTAVGQERRAREDDPAPGLLRVTRHPQMWGIGLWGIGHLAANGDAAGIVFFGFITLLALGGSFLIDRRKRLALGTDWPRFAEVTSNIPFLALLAGRTKLRPGEIGVAPVLAGLLLYAVLLLAHPLFTGVPVIVP